MRFPDPVRWLAALAALAMPAGAAAAPSITIYTHDLALVRESRTVDLANDTLRLADLPERLDFGSLGLTPGSGRVTRLAWRWDVPAGDDLLGRALGRRVRVLARDNRVVDGELMAADGGWVLVRSDDGSLHSVARAAVEDVQLSGVTAPLSVRPALEAVVEGARPGRQTAELAYLTGGLSWNAEHLLVRRGETEAEWSSRVTVQNATNVTWTGAALALVAGEPRRVSPPQPRPMMAEEFKASATMAVADLAQQTFSEYHLYTLERPALLRDHETQSLVMLEPRAVRVIPRYLYRGGEAVMAQLLVPNRRDGGLGVPLAAGRVRMVQPSADGVARLVGEDQIRHTPDGDTLTLEMGQAFDLTAERHELESTRISDRERESTVEITLRNHKSVPVTIVVDENVPGDFELLHASHPVVRREGSTLRFEVPVAAGRTAALRYTVRLRW
jgi:hypothetical protein